MKKRFMASGMLVLLISALLIGVVGTTVFASPGSGGAGSGDNAATVQAMADEDGGSAREVEAPEGRSGGDEDNDNIQHEFEGQEEHAD